MCYLLLRPGGTSHGETTLLHQCGKLNIQICSQFESMLSQCGWCQSLSLVRWWRRQGQTRHTNSVSCSTHILECQSSLLLRHEPRRSALKLPDCCEDTFGFPITQKFQSLVTVDSLKFTWFRMQFSHSKTTITHRKFYSLNWFSFVGSCQRDE